MHKSSKVVKEKTILMNGDMVRAILSGQKVQIRRAYPGDKIPDGTHVQPLTREWVELSPCPFGKTGDKLWVKEKWRVCGWDMEDARLAIDYAATPKIPNTTCVQIPRDKDPDGENFNALILALCDELERKGIKCDDDGFYHWEDGKCPLSWRPSINMPRWASRITLEITDVHVELVQDISESEIIMEGIQKSMGGTWCGSPHKAHGFPRQHNTAQEAFSDLWNSMYAKRGLGWGENPWVWAVTFRRVE